jgi:hypothetical protein
MLINIKFYDKFEQEVLKNVIDFNNFVYHRIIPTAKVYFSENGVKMENVLNVAEERIAVQIDGMISFVSLPVPTKLDRYQNPLGEIESIIIKYTYLDTQADFLELDKILKFLKNDNPALQFGFICIDGVLKQ